MNTRDASFIRVLPFSRVGGLWHGAKWTFVVWGAFHGLLLVLERWNGKRSFYHFLPKPGRIAATFLLMLFSWVLFRAESLTAAMEYFRSMFGFSSSGEVSALLGAVIYTPYHVLVLFICAFLVFQPLQAHDWALKPITWPRAAAEKESLEGMRYRPTGSFTVSNTFSTNNFGEVGLAQGTKPLIQRTEVERPGPAGSSATEADNLARGIVLDDGASTNFLLSGNATTCSIE